MFYAALDAGGTMPLTGQTRDVAGNLIGGRQVTVFLEGFRTKDTAANAKRFVTHSGPDGVWHLRIPGRDLTRDKSAWAQVRIPNWRRPGSCASTTTGSSTRASRSRS